MLDTVTLFLKLFGLACEMELLITQFGTFASRFILYSNIFH